MVRFFKSKKQQEEPEEKEEYQEQEEQDEEEIEEERKPVKKIAMKQPMKVVEQEITLSLLNNKLNYIITKLEEFGKEE